MAGSINKVILVGNLGRDPDVRTASDGTKIVNLSVATSETWKDRASGERRERTEWHRVVIFNDRLAEVAERYLRKGTKVYLEGQLQTRKWTDQSGAEKYTTEIVLQRYRGEMQMLDTPGGDDRREEQAQQAAPVPGGGGRLRRFHPLLTASARAGRDGSVRRGESGDKACWCRRPDRIVTGSTSTACGASRACSAARCRPTRRTSGTAPGPVSA